MGFLAFAAGSTLNYQGGQSGGVVAVVLVNSMLSGAWSSLTALVMSHWLTGGWSLLITWNGLLGGMVAATGGAAFMHSWAAW